MMDSCRWKEENGLKELGFDFIRGSCSSIPKQGIKMQAGKICGGEDMALFMDVEGIRRRLDHS